VNALAIAAAAGFVLGLGSAWKLTSMHYEHRIDVAAREAAELVAAANQKAQNAAADYEVWASLQRPKTITLTREVQREVLADVDCSARPLPDGLRDALTNAAADADQPGAADAVPAAPAAGADDLRGRGARLFGGPGGAEGLPSPASGPR